MLPRIMEELEPYIYGMPGTGWRRPIEEAVAKLDDEFPGWRLAQVKEKFGTLRFYADPPEGQTLDETQYKRFYDICREAEIASEKLCEVCGEPGKMRQGRWLKTLCDSHAD